MDSWRQSAALTSVGFGQRAALTSVGFGQRAASLTTFGSGAAFTGIA
jgi:hypothetical protein